MNQLRDCIVGSVERTQSQLRDERTPARRAGIPIQSKVNFQEMKVGMTCVGKGKVT